MRKVRRKRKVKEEKNMFFLLALSYAFPIIGGIIAKNNTKDEKFGKFCFTLSILHPFVIAFFAGIFEGLLGIEVADEIFSLIFFLIGVVISLILHYRIFSKDEFRYLIYVWYIGIIGFIVALINYSDKKRLLKESIKMVLFVTGYNIFLEFLIGLFLPSLIAY